MSKKSLIVLSICLVIAAGIVAYVWASGCCGEYHCICNGNALQAVETCNWHFTVDHSKDCGMGHDVYVYIKGQNGDPYIGFLLSLETVGPPPYPICMLYGTVLELEPNTVYLYYFGCADCEEWTATQHLNTGDCGS